MGGFGSGNRRTRKDVVEGRSALDTAALKRMKLLTPTPAGRRGILEWHWGGREPPSTIGYTLRLEGGEGSMRLDYKMTATGEKLDYAVRLATTPCHLGGARWWFLCPLVKGG
jgi:hypothetical protein